MHKFTPGQRVTAKLWGTQLEGTVVKHKTSLVWVRWDGQCSPSWVHPESLTAVLSGDLVDNLLQMQGFGHEQTGGGCTAYVKADGSFITYVTVHDDPIAPESLTEPVDVGTYRLDTGDLVGSLLEFATLAEALVYLADGK